MASAVATACRRTDAGRFLAPTPLRAAGRQAEHLQQGLTFLAPPVASGPALPPRTVESPAGFGACVRCRRSGRPRRHDSPAPSHRKPAVATGVFREAAPRAFSRLGGAPARGATPRARTAAAGPAPCPPRPSAVRCRAAPLFETAASAAAAASAQPPRRAARPFFRTPRPLPPARHAHSQSVSECPRRGEAGGAEAAKASPEEQGAATAAEGKGCGGEKEGVKEEEEEDEWAVNESVRVAGRDRETASSTPPAASPNTGLRATSGSGGPVAMDSPAADPLGNAGCARPPAKVDEASVGPTPDAGSQRNPTVVFPEINDAGNAAPQPAPVAPSPSGSGPPAPPPATQPPPIQSPPRDQQAPARAQPPPPPPGTFASSSPAPAQDEILSPSKSSAGLDLSGSLLVQQMLFSKAADAPALPGSQPPSDALPPPPEGASSGSSSAPEGGAARDAPPAAEGDAAHRGRAEDSTVPGVGSR
ncbi:MAG: hypothetical protein BJ554DRAFT_3003 [Olpidium bornovanus]|uniref:Uncharacterized protein n=1 Tax=Olpidium bornovanus TaxID=278681 RepID=A0A8H7ZQ05_9FUNG|nr:MAG: hypothetical protein BJ554DRAFT_3003 [Olpidium bornovanus]